MVGPPSPIGKHTNDGHHPQLQQKADDDMDGATIAAPPRRPNSPLPTSPYQPSPQCTSSAAALSWWSFFRTPRMNRLRVMTLTEPTSAVPFVCYEASSILVLLITWCCDLALVIQLGSELSATKMQFLLGLGSLVVTQFAYVRHCWMGHDCQPHDMLFVVPAFLLGPITPVLSWFRTVHFWPWVENLPSLRPMETFIAPDVCLDPLYVYIEHTAHDHAVFALHAVLHCVPFTLLRLYMILTGHPTSFFDVASLIAALWAFSLRSMLMSYSVERPMFYFLWLCWTLDLFSSVCTAVLLVWSWYHTPLVSLPNFISSMLPSWLASIQAPWLMWVWITKVILLVLAVWILIGPIVNRRRGVRPPRTQTNQRHQTAAAEQVGHGTPMTDATLAAARSAKSDSYTVAEAVGLPRHWRLFNQLVNTIWIISIGVVSIPFIIVAGELLHLMPIAWRLSTPGTSAPSFRHAAGYPFFRRLFGWLRTSRSWREFTDRLWATNYFLSRADTALPDHAHAPVNAIMGLSPAQAAAAHRAATEQHWGLPVAGEFDCRWDVIVLTALDRPGVINPRSLPREDILALPLPTVRADRDWAPANLQQPFYFPAIPDPPKSVLRRPPSYRSNTSNGNGVPPLRRRASNRMSTPSVVTSSTLASHASATHPQHDGTSAAPNTLPITDDDGKRHSAPPNLIVPIRPGLRYLHPHGRRSPYESKSFTLRALRGALQTGLDGPAFRRLVRTHIAHSVATMIFPLYALWTSRLSGYEPSLLVYMITIVHACVLGVVVLLLPRAAWFIASTLHVAPWGINPGLPDWGALAVEQLWETAQHRSVVAHQLEVATAASPVPLPTELIRLCVAYLPPLELPDHFPHRPPSPPTSQANSPHGHTSSSSSRSGNGGRTDVHHPFIRQPSSTFAQSTGGLRDGLAEFIADDADVDPSWFAQQQHQHDELQHHQYDGR